MLKPLSRLKAFILDLLFPLECLGCGREKAWLCPACFRRLKFGHEKIIDREKNNNLKAPALNKIFIAGDYDDALLADLIKKFKYHFLTALGKPLADFLTIYWSGQLTLLNLDNLPAADEAMFPSRSRIIPDNVLIIPIPLSKKRRRWRGFNQAEILARGFAAHFGYELSDRLKRIKHRPAQASLNERERLKNISGVFAYDNSSPAADISGRTIILVDDVVTTGATLNEAALALRAQGATKVYGLVLAKG